LITDVWDGLDSFFQPGDEIVTAESAQDVLDALDRSAGGLERMARRARERALDEHTADRRAIDFEDALVMSVVA
jgi:spore maturation protein CgeB